MVRKKQLIFFLQLAQFSIKIWLSFGLTNTHHELIEKITKTHNLFIGLICNDDGICCISYKEYKQIVDFRVDDINNISVQRKKRESYQVSGKLGVLPYKISDTDFPRRIFCENGV